MSLQIHRASLSVIGLLIIVCGISILIYFFAPYSFLQQDAPGDEISYMSQQLKQANDFLENNDFKSAIALYDQMLADAKYEANVHTLILYKAYALFATSNPESTKEAITLLGSLLTDETADEVFRAWAINQILEFYYSSQSTYVLSEIRALPIFAEQRTLSNDEFLQSLSELSFSLHPTALGEIHLAIPLAREISYSTELTDEILRSHALRIEQHVNASYLREGEDALFNTPQHHMLLAHYRGVLLSAASVGDIDPDTASAQFENALRIASEHETDLSMQTLSWYTHFYYAAHVLQNEDVETSNEVVNDQLTFLMEKIESSSDTSLFSAFLKAAHSYPESNNYRLLQMLTTQNDAFREFLQEKFFLTF